jgi:8-oxo-dGTP pyrophosphatase MutT (NUDIX family)
MVEARPASTVMLARRRHTPASDSEDYEVFMVRRPVASEFAADVFVFPGGAVRPDDSGPAVDRAVEPFDEVQALRRLAERGGDPPAGPAEAIGFWLAALRELFEEAGVLLARPDPRAAGRARSDAQAERLERGRVEVQAGRASLAELAGAEGLRLACEDLVYFSHWITPPSMPRRYDTRFFLACMPEGQEARHCAIETVDGLWVTPAAALDGFADGTFPLVFPTLRHLERMAEHARLDDLVEFAATKPIVTVDAELEDDDVRRPRLPAELEGCW